MNKLFSTDQIIESECFDAHQDWSNPIVGFFIIASKDTSRRSITDFSKEELSELFGLITQVRGAMDKMLGIKDVYLFQNEDTEHGFHIWLFPRHEWMEECGRKIESVRNILDISKKERAREPYISEVKDAARKVRDYLNR